VYYSIHQEKSFRAVLFILELDRITYLMNESFIDFFGRHHLFLHLYNQQLVVSYH
jgi:hypothetical protein